MIKRLPAAPGMETVYEGASDGGAKPSEVLVHCYLTGTDSYVVTQTDDGMAKPSVCGEPSPGTPGVESREGGNVKGPSPSPSPYPSIEDSKVFESTAGRRVLSVVHSSELRPAASAKLYPLIDELVYRADRAARASLILLESPKIDSVINNIDLDVEKLSNSVLPQDRRDAVARSIDTMVPTSKEVKNIYAILKDEELTVLLEKGQERLRQLVSSEIPKSTETALRSLGIEIEQSTKSTVEQSREHALAALEKLLSEHAHTDIMTVKQTLGKQFSTMFDFLAEASKSDNTLNSIFDGISGKTSLWQEESGRLLKSRSVSLFVEGTQHLQARATKIFSSQSKLSATDTQDRLVKAFTEGDAAVSRLKSIELAEAIRRRLFNAIEIRSESQGGLDGLIAGAFATISTKDIGKAEKRLMSTISDLQNSAPSTVTHKKETLLSLISNGNEYQDIALIRIEKGLVGLESQLLNGMSAEVLASVARGDGGSAALFEPIALRATEEIEKQLDAAEKSASDPTALKVLSHVRRLVSGDLTVAGLLNEMSNFLNDENIAEASENLIKGGEMVLDALEGPSNDAYSINGVLSVVEKAGITKQSVMDHVEKMDMDSILVCRAALHLSQIILSQPTLK